jgi:hypothetical protein
MHGARPTWPAGPPKNITQKIAAAIILVRVTFRDGREVYYIASFYKSYYSHYSYHTVVTIATIVIMVDIV